MNTLSNDFYTGFKVNTVLVALIIYHTTQSSLILH
jgi:hypothetical protein